MTCERLGSVYGGYWVPARFLGGVCYDLGVGEDATFALALRAKVDEIHLFDPTNKAAIYWQKIEDKELANDIDPICNMTFHNIGVADANRDYYFYPPKNPEHVSYSIENIQATTEPLVLPCYTIKTIMNILGHDELSVLKMDIEGAEYGVVSSMDLDRIYPQVVIMEAHSQYGTDNYLCPTRMHFFQSHYNLLIQEGRNYTFGRKDLF